MASLIRKVIRGHAYYYARECRRVDGKPKIVWQMYLGKVEDLIDRAGGPPPESVAPPPLQARVTDFGAVAALYDLARRLDRPLERSILRLQTFGLGESTAQQMISDGISDWPAEVELGFRAGAPQMEIKLSINSADASAARARCREVSGR